MPSSSAYDLVSSVNDLMSSPLLFILSNESPDVARPDLPKLLFSVPSNMTNLDVEKEPADIESSSAEGFWSKSVAMVDLPPPLFPFDAFEEAEEFPAVDDDEEKVCFPRLFVRRMTMKAAATATATKSKHSVSTRCPHDRVPHTRTSSSAVASNPMEQL